MSRKSGRPGPAIDKRKLSVLGKYLLMAMELAEIPSLSELARHSQIDVSTLGKLIKGETTVKDETLFRIIDTMHSPEWLEERIVTAAGYSSRKQRQWVSDEEAIREAEERVRAEIQQRTVKPTESDPE